MAECLPTMNPPPETADWEALRPALDEALDELVEPERKYLLIRFLQNCFARLPKPLGRWLNGLVKRSVPRWEWAWISCPPAPVPQF